MRFPKEHDCIRNHNYMSLTEIMTERAKSMNELSKVFNEAEVPGFAGKSEESAEPRDVKASNESLVQNDARVFEPSLLTGDGGVLEITAVLENTSISSCSFCTNTICSKTHKTQHWTGTIFQLNQETLQNPNYTSRFYLPPEYINGSNSNKTIDLSKIVNDLPNVCNLIREPSYPYKELENILKQVNEIEINGLNETIKSIKDTYNTKDNVTAPYSKETQLYPRKDISSSNLYFIDCEYTLQVSIPQKNEHDEEGVYHKFCQGKMFEPKETYLYRWVFIPSSDRFEKNIKLDYSHFKREKGVTEGDTLCLVVVRGNQFESYRKRFGETLPIIQLPEVVIGVGYARFWIVKIAKRFQMENIWMIDDSVEFFKEYIPTKENDKYIKDEDVKDQSKHIRCPHYCFQKMESILKDQPNVVGICPRTYRPYLNVSYEFSNSAIKGVMLLNISKLTEKNINFRPELRYMEDMIFSKECTNAGFKVCIWNAIVFKDTNFSTTGANTPCQSPKSEMQTQNRGSSESQRELFKDHEEGDLKCDCI